MKDRALVMVPTYDERENVEALVDGLRALPMPLDILFVDDNSTDGTGVLLDELAARNPGLHVLHRPGKLGIGSAHRDGIRWAYANGYRELVTMDCDFTHPPAAVPLLVAKAAEGFDVVVGSRYLAADSLAGWNPYRKTLTRVGHLLTRMLLGMRYDATNAFRYYRLTAIPEAAFDLVTSRGYSFFFESLFVLHFNGFRIGQISTALPKRTYGHSKMDGSEIKRSVELLAVTSFKKLFNPEKFELASPLPPDVARPDVPRDEQGWDDYWEQQKVKPGGVLYDAVAAFYRRFIIRRSLNWFVGRYFERGAHVLHAGCGSGQVDVDIRDEVSITALDISLGALAFYRKTNGTRGRLLHGSLFQIPLPDASMDGAYNLGVMEHFTPSEIAAILGELRRVVRPRGRIILFWPPEFGLSVLFFKALTWVFVHVLRRRNVKFHPDEITRVASRRHVANLLEASGFRVVHYYFGPKDLFTYAVIVAENEAGAVGGAADSAARLAGSMAPAGRALTP
jgi:dolichol-phosphate mannosyltransferase